MANSTNDAAETAIYTYEPGSSPPNCHAYGPYTDQAQVDQATAKIKELWPTWIQTPLPVEPLSPKFATPKGEKVYAIYWTQFGFGSSGSQHIAFGTDPAALDALGRAMEASPLSNGYMVLPLEELPA